MSPQRALASWDRLQRKAEQQAIKAGHTGAQGLGERRRGAARADVDRRLLGRDIRHWQPDFFRWKIVVNTRCRSTVRGRPPGES
jgi:hypothetical protein